MRTRPMRVGIGVVAAAVALVVGCGTPEQQEPSATPSPTPSATETSSPAPVAPVTGNGSVYTVRPGGEATAIHRHAIDVSGSVGEGVEVFTGPATDYAAEDTAVVDGAGQTLVLGTFSAYWTTAIQVVDLATEQVSAPVDAPRWCGGEGLTYNPCVVLDDTRLVRSTELGGAGLPEATIYVSSLESGETLAEYGPFPGLSMMFGTTDPDTVMITTTDVPSADPPELRPGTVARLDVTSGQVTPIGSHSQTWQPLCAIGTDSMLGFTQDGALEAAVVGPAVIGSVTWPEQDNPLGCSADGRFLYVQQTTEPSALIGIDLASGISEPVLSLQPPEWVAGVTR